MCNQYHHEGKRIYESIFQSGIPDQVLTRYIAAAILMDKNNPLRISSDYVHAINECNDLEALEAASTLFYRNSLLSLRFRLMVFIAETSPESSLFFVNETDGFCVAIFQILFSVVRYLFKLTIGTLYLMKYKNV